MALLNWHVQGRGAEALRLENHYSNNQITPGSISKDSRSQRNPMQPLNSNSLFECVKLGECTPPNHTNSALYHNGRLLVNFYAEAKDCAEYHVHGSEGNLPQSPDCRSYCSRPRGKKLIGNAVNAPHLHSTPTMSGRVVHKNLNSLIVVLGSSSHCYRHSVLKNLVLALK